MWSLRVYWKGLSWLVTIVMEKERELPTKSSSGMARYSRQTNPFRDPSRIRSCPPKLRSLTSDAVRIGWYSCNNALNVDYCQERKSSFGVVKANVFRSRHDFRRSSSDWISHSKSSSLIVFRPSRNLEDTTVCRISHQVQTRSCNDRRVPSLFEILGERQVIGY